MKHKLDTDRYLSIEEATELADENNYGYRDICFCGVVRIFGTADAYIETINEHAHKDEGFDEAQVRIMLEDKLDIDLNGEGNRRPWYRPLKIFTGGELITPNIEERRQIH